MKYTAQEMKKWDVNYDAGTLGWLPRRPENYKFESLRNRLSNAWRVLTGDYDVLDWYNLDRNIKIEK